MSAERPYIDKEHPQVYKALAKAAVVSRAASNEAGAGQPGATVTRLTVKPSKLTAKGIGFTPQVQVFVDGIGFNSAAVVKRGKKVTQSGALANGQTIGQYLTRGRDVELTFVNSDQRLTKVRFTVP